MLTFFVLTIGFVDIDVDRLATPFEFLAAAARTRPVGIESHGSTFEGVDEILIGSLVYLTKMATRCNKYLVPFTALNKYEGAAHEVNGALSESHLLRSN